MSEVTGAAESRAHEKFRACSGPVRPRWWCGWLPNRKEHVLAHVLDVSLPGLESAGCCDSAKADPPLPKLLGSGLPRRPAAEISAESELSKISLSFLLDFFFDFVFFFFFVFLTFFFFLVDFAGNTGVGAKAELQEDRSESSSVNLSPIVSSAIYAE